MSKRINQQGLTLIEVLMVVVILGIVTAIVATTGLKSGADNAALLAQADKLVSDLRSMHDKAIAHQLTVEFALLSDGTGYQYQIDSKTETVNLDRGVKISASPTQFTFNTDGTRSGSGNYEINLSVGDKNKTIEVSQTGLVQLKN